MWKGRFPRIPNSRPLHFDIFRPAKLRLAAQKMIYVPGGVRVQPGGMNGFACDRLPHLPMMSDGVMKTRAGISSSTAAGSSKRDQVMVALHES